MPKLYPTKVSSEKVDYSLLRARQRVAQARALVTEAAADMAEARALVSVEGGREASEADRERINHAYTALLNILDAMG